jgi:ubiquinone/menaquinone biosynthesis C-methylase UbiE
MPWDGLRAMRSSLWLLILIGCARSAAPISTAPCPASAPAAPVAPVVEAPPAPAEPDEAAVIAKSHALFEALDRPDLAAFQAAVGPGFTLFERQRLFDVGFLTKGITGRLERKAPSSSRSCKRERVYRNAGALVYLGTCVEQEPKDGGGTTESEGWNTVVWVRDGADWKAVHWQWQKGGIEAERELWNETLVTGTHFKRTPNQLLVDTVQGKKPGTALDVAMGQGRNAVFLASKGWKVTGVDISNEGIRIAKEAAAKQKLKLDTVEADVAKYDFGKARWDLVTLIYAGNSKSDIERIKTGIKPKGLFVVEFFAKEPSSAVGGFGPGELAAQFQDGWTILKDEIVDDIADWSMRKTKLARFVAQKAGL